MDDHRCLFLHIGKPKDGKSQVIVRFLSYRVREKVYNSKKELKRHPDKIFITENLTQYRTNLVKALAELKYSRKIHAYWTTDGRIYLKTNENSRKMQIRNHDDIMDILRRSSYQLFGEVTNNQGKIV
jgi:hypothetical protein